METNSCLPLDQGVPAVLGFQGAPMTQENMFLWDLSK